VSAVALLSLQACGETGAGDVVTRSDLGELTRADLEAFILTQPENRRSPAGGQSLKQWRTDLAIDMVVARFLSTKGDDLSDDPDAVDRIRGAREAALVRAARITLIDSRIEVDEEEIRRFYDQNPDQFGHPEQLRLRHIYRRVARDAAPEEREAVRRELEEMLVHLRNGAHFGDLARMHSDSETSHLDGLIGRLSRGSLDATLEEIVWVLDEGELSDVVETAVGFHIFRVDDRIEPFHMDFEDAHGRLTRRLTNEAREKLEQEVFEQFLDQSGALYRPELLEAEPPPAADEAIFSLGDEAIFAADVDAYRRTVAFLTLRETPAREWLAAEVMSRLLLWHAQQTQLASDTVVAAGIELAENTVKARIGAEHFLERRIEERTSSGELEEYYNEHYKRFQNPKLYQLRLITVGIAGYDRPYDVFEYLERLGAEIRADRRDLAEAAMEISDDPNAADGGLTPWLLLEGLASWAGPRAQHLILDLEMGELSEPILIERYNQAELSYRRQGYMLARVEGIKHPTVRTYEEAYDSVVQRFAEVHRAEFEEETREEILAAVHAEVLEENL